MKKYNPREIEILKIYEGPDKFTPEDMEILAKGDGTIKLEYRANKVIEKYDAWVKKPISREEVFQTFTTKVTRSLDKGHVLVLEEALLRKGIITKEMLTKTEHELIAEKYPDLCSECIHAYPDCKNKPVFAKDKFSDLEGPLGDKIINCDAFEKPKQEGMC